MKIAFISTDWSQNKEREKNNLYGGVGYYRLVKPMKYLQDTYECVFYGSDVKKLAKDKSNEEFWNDFVSDHDLILIKSVDNPQAINALVFYCKMKGVPLIVDIDDNLYEVRADQPSYKDYKAGEQKRAYMASFLSFADAVFCSTEPLAEKVNEYNKKVFKVSVPTYVLPNCNDIGDFPPNKVHSDKFIIGWQGSTTHNADLRLVLPVLDKILQKYPDVFLELLGGVEEASLKELFKDWSLKSLDKLMIVGGTASWKGYPELLSQQAWNIGIAPLVDEPFNRSKSHIKWMEYATQKIPCVASKVYPYCEDIQGTKTIQDGVTGFLCTPDEWESTLEKVIENRELCKKVGEQAYDFVVKDWQYKDHIYKWKTAIDDVMKNYKNQSASIKKKLLGKKK